MSGSRQTNLRTKTRKQEPQTHKTHSQNTQPTIPSHAQPRHRRIHKDTPYPGESIAQRPYKRHQRAVIARRFREHRLRGRDVVVLKYSIRLIEPDRNANCQESRYQD